jgi:hypothetical protein
MIRITYTHVCDRCMEVAYQEVYSLPYARAALPVPDPYKGIGDYSLCHECAAIVGKAFQEAMQK